MKIYKVELREIGPTPNVVRSSYVAPRSTIRTEYFLKKESADKRRDEMNKSISDLGLFGESEVDVTEIEVQE